MITTLSKSRLLLGWALLVPAAFALGPWTADAAEHSATPPRLEAPPAYLAPIPLLRADAPARAGHKAALAWEGVQAEDQGTTAPLATRRSRPGGGWMVPLESGQYASFLMKEQRPDGSVGIDCGFSGEDLRAALEQRRVASSDTPPETSSE